MILFYNMSLRIMQYISNWLFHIKGLIILHSIDIQITKLIYFKLFMTDLCFHSIHINWLIIDRFINYLKSIILNNYFKLIILHNFVHLNRFLVVH